MVLYGGCVFLYGLKHYMLSRKNLAKVLQIPFLTKFFNVFYNIFLP